MTSRLRFLGYFAVIEALLTHKPNPRDPYESITRQVTTKMALLNKRFGRPLDYDKVFSNSEPKKVPSQISRRITSS